MLNIGGSTRIFVYSHDTDMRKGFAGLSGIIRGELGAEPTDGSLFVFINKRRDRMKLLHFISGGFWLYYRLLEAGTFESLKTDSETHRIEIDATELSMLLAGVSLAQSGKRRKRFVA